MIMSKRMSINKTGFVSVIFWLCVLMLEYFYFTFVATQNIDYLTISIIIGLSLAAKIFLITYNQYGLVSFFSFFFTFYCLFHFGEVVMMGLFPEYEYAYANYLEMFMHDKFIVLQTIKICVLCIDCFFLGGLFYRVDILPENSFISSCKIRNGAGQFLFWMLLPFRLLLDCLALVNGMNGGYGTGSMVQLPGVISALGFIWNVSLPLYYIELDGKRKRIFSFVVILYLIVTMISGGRGHRLIAMIGLLIVVNADNVKISFTKIVKYVIACLLMMMFLRMIFDMRHVGINAYFNSFDSYFVNISEKNMLFETIGTFGETIFTPYLVLEGYGSSVNPFFGEGFAKSVVSIVPDVFGWFVNINNEAIFQKMLGTDHTIGGSFAGDLYYNFAGMYFVAAIAIGFFYNKWSCLVHRALSTGSYNCVYKYLPFLILSFWWIRDSVGGLVRNVVWCLFAIWLYKKLIGKNNSVVKNGIKTKH